MRLARLFIGLSILRHELADNGIPRREYSSTRTTARLVDDPVQNLLCMITEVSKDLGQEGAFPIRTHQGLDNYQLCLTRLA